MGYGDVVFSHGNYETKFNIGILPKVKSDLLYSVFYKLFDVVHADTQELKDEAHRLRYQVFCLENKGYEDPAAHPDGMERDPYDVNAEHALLIYKPKNKAIGTVRVIKPNLDDLMKSFPLQTLCDSHYLHDETYVKNSCEFSRLCISRELRQEIKEEVRNLSGMFNFSANDQFSIYERPLLNIGLAAAPLGLIRGAFELAMKNGALNVFGVMEPRNIGRLEQSGLVHETIGPKMDYHGVRVPFVCNVLEVFENAIINNHEIWNVVSVKGENHRRALEIYEKQGSSEH